MSQRLNPDDATKFVRDALYRGPVYRKLYDLRRRRPELAYEVDELAMALREMGDKLETFVKAQAVQHDADDGFSALASLADG